MRKKAMIPSQLKSLLFLVLISISSIIVFSLIIVGSGQNNLISNGFGIPGFFIKPDNIVFNKNNRGEPKIKVYITKKNKVEEMYLEEYVRGVVSAEMPAGFNIEALKAQAVASRTFALAHMEQFGGKSYNSDNGANVCDTVQCQVFINKEDRFKSWPKNKAQEYWSKVTEAVKETSGQVLVSNGKLVMEPFYFAVSSGRTENSQDVFSEYEPYLKSVDSPGEELAPKYKSMVKVPYNEFIEKISSYYPKSGVSSKNIKNQIEIKSRTSGGGIKEIRVGKIIMSGVKFRSIMGLNSADFNVKFNNSYIEIDCIGYGHDVGMSQWGANAMAKKGNNYMEILKHYYSGVGIEKINE